VQAAKFNILCKPALLMLDPLYRCTSTFILTTAL